jgi:unsaturated rhamnogalacturonyl hydrolase
MPDAGFYAWGQIFKNLGAQTDVLSVPPNSRTLTGADIYIIVDPDTEKETPKPNYVAPDHVRYIADWVKKGGVLVMMGNDGQNAELDKFDTLARRFGVGFNKDRRFEVIGNDYKMGGVDVAPGNEIFTTARKVFVKEVSTLSLSGNARAVLAANGFNIAAVARYGKGTVFVIGDPWLYNEYVDGRRLPLEYENFKAAEDLSRWLIAQARRK